jgi:hypothetical protein
MSSPPLDKLVLDARALDAQLERQPGRTAASITSALKRAISRVESPCKVSLLGEPDVGKSALLSHLLGLRLGPGEGGTFHTRAVLFTGSGQSTAFPLVIEQTEAQEISLEVRPVEEEELRIRYQTLAADLQRRSTGEGAREPPPRRLREEERRVLVTLAGLSPQRGSDGMIHMPLEELVARPRAQPEQLEEELIRLALEAAGPMQTRTFAVSRGSEPEQEMRDLKRLLESLGLGRLQILPDSVTARLLEAWQGLRLGFADLMGVDASVSGREDVQELLEDEEALILV